MSGSDNLDHASDMENAHRERAIAELRKPPITPKDFNGEDCVDCGDEIPEARLSMYKFTCIACQMNRERLGRGFIKH